MAERIVYWLNVHSRCIGIGQFPQIGLRKGQIVLAISHRGWPAFFSPPPREKGRWRWRRRRSLRPAAVRAEARVRPRLFRPRYKPAILSPLSIPRADRFVLRGRVLSPV